MYLEIRYYGRKNGEKVPTAVLRKCERKNGKVIHKDIGYLSGLSIDTLYAIRELIKIDNLSEKKNITSS